MSDALDRRFDLDRLSGRTARLSGQVSTENFSRVLELHQLDPQGLYAELELDGHSEGKVSVTGHIRGVVTLVCQRCLEPFDMAIDNEVALMVLDESQMSIELPTGFEAFIPEHDSFTGIDIVEEELLLVLPMSPVHKDEAQCGPLIGKLRESRSSNDDAKDTSERSTRPFEILKQLKKH